jgi:M6 family metalloprotease-like protein
MHKKILMILSFVFLTCGFIAMAVPCLTSAMDLSKGIILDVPQERIESQFGKIPPSQLTRQDSIALASYRFIADTLKVLAILVEWGDNRPGTYSRETFDSLLFSRNVFPGGSVADYFYEVSYGQANVVGEVIDWYDAGWYSGYFNFESLFPILDPVIDYSQFDGNNDGDVDAVTFIRSGNGMEDSQDPNDIWSYAYVYPPGSGPGPFDGVHIPRWNTSPETQPLHDSLYPPGFTGEDTLNKIRVFCHELTHCFGLPDLYDYDDKLDTTTYYTPGDWNDHPVNDWCLMGYYGYGLFSIGSQVPSHLCGWSKKEIGWIDPIVLPKGAHNNVVIHNIETTNDSSLYLLPLNMADGEYFLLEYRNPGSTAKFDKINSDYSCYFWPALSFGGDPLDRGLLITHVHDSLGAYYWRINNGTPDYPHYTVKIEDAGYNPDRNAQSNPEGWVTDSAQWWYPYETQIAAPFSNDVSGQEVFSPTTYPNSDGYYDPTGIVVRVDSIINDKLYAYIYIPTDSIPFAPAVNYGAGDGPYSVFCADLDGDTDLDLAVANDNSDNVSILKNNGDGTFQSAVNYGAGDYPRSVFCADLDNDNDLDLAVANGGSDNISILKNNGDGIFASAINHGAGDRPLSVFCADLDNDNDLDLAVANDYSNNVSILKNNGDGTFQSAVNYGAGDLPISVFCADLDGDLDLDLAVANEGSFPYLIGSVSILKNNGDGTFQSAVNYGAGDYPRSVFCADLDNDNDLDLAVANEGNFPPNIGWVSIFENNGDGTFQTKVDYGAGYGAGSVFCADLDGDADLDLAVTNVFSGNVSILKNNGDGTFQSAVNYGAGDGPWSVFCADLDGDADLDLAVANVYSDNVSILMNLTQTPGNSPPYPFPLLSPADGDTTSSVVEFHWAKTQDVNLGDQIRYDLHITHVVFGFPSDTTFIIHSNLVRNDYTDTLDIGRYEWRVKAKDNWGAETWSKQTWHFIYFIRGDVNADSSVNVSDVVYLINYLFIGGPPPDPMAAGDANCDGTINVNDVVYLINYLFISGPPPCGG